MSCINFFRRSWRVGDLQWWGYLTFFRARNKPKYLVCQPYHKNILSFIHRHNVTTKRRQGIMTNVCKWKTVESQKYHSLPEGCFWKLEVTLHIFSFYFFLISLYFLIFYFILFFENNCNLYFVNGNTLFHLKNQKKIQDFYSLNKLLLQ